MALSKDKKKQIISDVVELLNGSKMTVLAKYTGTSVKSMQNFRRLAKNNGTTIKIAKNRLVKKAFTQTLHLKNVDTSFLDGMLLYAFNSNDEVAPAQVIATFSKEHPTLEFVGAVNADGKFLNAYEVKELASLPSKQQLISDIISKLTSPINDTISGLAGNLQGILDSLIVKSVN